MSRGREGVIMAGAAGFLALLGYALWSSNPNAPGTPQPVSVAPEPADARAEPARGAEPPETAVETRPADLSPPGARAPRPAGAAQGLATASGPHRAADAPAVGRGAAPAPARPPSVRAPEGPGAPASLGRGSPRLPDDDIFVGRLDPGAETGLRRGPPAPGPPTASGAPPGFGAPAPPDAGPGGALNVAPRAGVEDDPVAGAEIGGGLSRQSPRPPSGLGLPSGFGAAPLPPGGPGLARRPVEEARPALEPTPVLTENEPTPGPVLPAEGAPAPAPSPAAPAGPVAYRGAPEIDILRVEPDGSTVIAGRARPGREVDIVLGDRVVASARADASGQWVAVLAIPLTDAAQELRVRMLAEAAPAVPEGGPSAERGEPSASDLETAAPGLPEPVRAGAPGPLPRVAVGEAAPRRGTPPVRGAAIRPPTAILEAPRVEGSPVRPARPEAPRIAAIPRSSAPEPAPRSGPAVPSSTVPAVATGSSPHPSALPPAAPPVGRFEAPAIAKRGWDIVKPAPERLPSLPLGPYFAIITVRPDADLASPEALMPARRRSDPGARPEPPAALSAAKRRKPRIAEAEVDAGASAQPEPALDPPLTLVTRIDGPSPPRIRPERPATDPTLGGRPVFGRAGALARPPSSTALAGGRPRLVPPIKTAPPGAFPPAADRGPEIALAGDDAVPPAGPPAPPFAAPPV
ncbi:MAG: hypothetical protein ACFBSD_10085, partial [Paracoccaceae bacterium]